MRWSCPHCGVNLAVSDEKLGSGWSFSRCYKCGGFALVRKSEVNLIKVDKAPVGENVLLPEANEVPVLSRDAAKNLANIINNPKPTVLPNTQTHASSESDSKAVPKFLTENTEAPTFATKGPNHVVSAKPQYRFLPMAIGLTGMITIASGVYLYLQGEAIWNQIRAPQQKVVTRTPVEVPTQQETAPTSVEPATPGIITANMAPLLTDQLRQSAMAPTRSDADANTKAVKEALNSANTTESLENEETASANDNNLIVRVRAANTKLRSGPGLTYSIRGYANPTVEYSVLEWRERWFRVSPKSAEDVNQSSAWVRNDLVEIVRDK